MKALMVGGPVAAAVALLLGLLVIAATGGAPAAAADTAAGVVCVTSGPLPGLSTVQAGNARTIAAVAEAMGGGEGGVAAVIAVMAADTESGLRVLGNPTVATGGVSVQGEGDNEDSLGLFQQRASWGNVAQRLDPQQSTRLFLTRLLAVRGWDAESPWVAAQQVQQSAYDGHPRPANHDSSVYGGNYQTHLGLAQRLVARIDRDAARLSCGGLSGGLPASTAPGSHGLPADYTIPTTATAAETKVVVFAIGQLDKPYVFDAAGPTAYDCSGLTMAAWAQAGVTLPHSAAEQATAGAATTPGALAPGDLVLVPGDDGTLAAPGHVGLYLGRGLVLNAADPTDGIRVQTYANFLQVGHGLAALRHLD